LRQIVPSSPTRSFSKLSTYARASSSVDLDRFVQAQDTAQIYDHAIAELRAGRKTTHWMWFVFPQIAGLGSSPMAKRFAIASIDEAVAYLCHPVLGARLRAAVAALLALPAPTKSRAGKEAEAIFGGGDAMKLRSSLTLFAHAAPPDDDLFERALKRYFAGVADPRTEERLAAASS
jgi:uncharacterized protein (DUF1810 family)